MKRERSVFGGIVGLCLVLAVFSLASGADTGMVLPDGLAFLKTKMDAKEIPEVDLNRLKFDLPENLPEEVKGFGGFLWSGTNRSRSGTVGVVVPLLLLSYDPGTEEVKFLRIWEAGRSSKPGWGMLTGRPDKEIKDRFELTTAAGTSFTLVARKAGSPVLRASDGYEADLVKTGTVAASALANHSTLGRAVPAFSLTDLAGHTIASNDLKGKPVLLVFYINFD
jgi:hypothetical protein